MINFENIFYQLDTPYCIFDQQGRFLSVNAAVEHLLGYSKSELLNYSWWDLLHPIERPDRANLFKDMAEHGGVKFAICSYLINATDYVQMEWKFEPDNQEEIIFANPKITPGESLILDPHQHLHNSQGNGTTITLPTFHEVFNQTQLIEKIAEAMPADLKLTDITKEQPLFSNHKLAEKLGYTESEFLALGLDRLTKIVHPEDLDHFILARNNIVRDKKKSGA